MSPYELLLSIYVSFCISLFLKKKIFFSSYYLAHKNEREISFLLLHTGKNEALALAKQICKYQSL